MSDKAKAKVKTKVKNVKVKYIREEGYKDLQDWMEDPNNVYIGRGGIVFVKNKDNPEKKERFPKKASIWCNTFKLGKNCTSREDSLRLFKEHITSLIEGDPETYNLEELRGKNLGCWCHPDSCHGDVLLELLEIKDKSCEQIKID